MNLRPHPLVAAVLALLATACTLLPWWQADRAPALLVDGPPLPLDADEWTGVELLGTPTAVALATLAVVGIALAVVGHLADRTPRTSVSERSSAAVAAAVGAPVAAGAVRVLLDWGSSGAVGAWFGGLLGLLAVAAALVRARPPRAQA
nr:hypothetical protein [Pseudonocardiales bacterium]